MANVSKIPNIGEGVVRLASDAKILVIPHGDPGMVEAI